MSTTKYLRLLAIALVLGFLLTGPALAKDSYQYEVAGHWFKSDTDYTEVNGYSLTGEMYFSPVNTKDHPLAEAYFLERIGSVGITASKLDVEMSFANSATQYTGDSKSFGLHVAYTQPNLPYLFLAGYTKSDFGYDAPLSIDSSADVFFVGAGYYIMDNVLVGINYQQLDADLGSGNNQTDKRYSVYGKQVRELQNNTAYNILIGLDIIESESAAQTYDNWELEVSGDYYFTNFISIGAGLGIHRGDEESEEGNEYTLNNKAYFNRNVGVELSYSLFEADNASGQDSKNILFSVIGRF